MILAWSTLFVLLTVATTAPPPGDAEIHWARSYDTAFEEANDRGVPLVLIIIQDGEEANEDVWANSLDTKEFIRACQRTVNIIGNRGKEEVHGTKTVKVGDREETVCKKFGGGIQCLVHNRMEVGIFRDFAQQGLVKTPQVIIALPDQTVIKTLVDRHPLDDYVKAIEQAHKKLPDGLTWDEAEDLTAQLDQATAWLEAGEVDKIIDFAVPMRDRNSKARLIERARLMLDRVVDRGMDELAEAEKQIAAKAYPEALDLLADVRQRYQGTTVEKAAKVRYTRLSKKKEVKQAVAQYNRETKARELLTKGDELASQGKQDEAERLYDTILTKFTDTAVARKLRERRGNRP